MRESLQKLRQNTGVSPLRSAMKLRCSGRNDVSYSVGGVMGIYEALAGAVRFANAHHTTPPASRRGPRLSDDKAVAKMGHPDLWLGPNLWLGEVQR